MRFPSFIPKAHRITREEAEKTDTNDRVFCLKFPIKLFLILFGALIVLGLGMNILGEFIEDNSVLSYASMFLFTVIFGSVFIIAFITDVKMIISEGEVVDISSKKGGKIKSWLMFAGIGVILLFLAVVTGDKGNAKGAYPLYVLIIFLIIRMLFKCTVKPLFTYLEIRSREKRCTLPIKADLIRNISTWDEKSSESDQQFGSIPVYMYCYAEQFYRIYIKDVTVIDPGEPGTFDLYIDPEHSEKYLIPDYFKVDRAEFKSNLSLMIFLIIASLFFMLPAIFKFIVDRFI